MPQSPLRIGTTSSQESTGTEPKKVLIADDSITTVMHLSILLRRMGFRVLAAKDGLEALKLLQAERPDLLLLDLNMPLMDGYAVLRSLKDSPALAKTPVIVVTVEGDEEAQRQCRHLGCDGYLTKPIHLGKLHDLIHEKLTYAGARRRFLRVEFPRRVKVYVRGEEREYLGVTLSEGGIYLRSREPLAVGTQVIVTVPLGAGDDLLCQGTVLYARELFGEELTIDPGFAVRFLTPEVPDLRRLREFIRAQLAGTLLQDPEGTDIVV